MPVGVRLDSITYLTDDDLLSRGKRDCDYKNTCGTVYKLGLTIKLNFKPFVKQE